MKDNDDTATPTARALTPLVNGHALAVTDAGKVVSVVTPEHAAEHHPDLLASGEYTTYMVRYPTYMVRYPKGERATEAYRDGWERIFGRGKAPTAGEA